MNTTPSAKPAHPHAIAVNDTMTRRMTIVGLATLAAIGLMSFQAKASSEAIVIPAYAGPAPAAAAGTEVAVVAGGCFWGVQGVFQHVKGVSNAVSGYAGGDKKTAMYEMVGSGNTGHAEAVQITYDPRQISYARILQIYFSVAHDPTQLNRQGPDSGPQYRSAIFPANDDQARVAKAYITQLDQAKVFKRSIVTKIEPARPFYAAEDYHQDFLVRNPTYPYIVVNDMPKVEDLKQLFPGDFKSTPSLVMAGKKAG